MAQSVKMNFILNVINTTSKVLFPLITFPYAARVLNPEGLGEVGFFSSIIQYVVLFSSIGIPLYAIREVAKVRNNIDEKSITVLEIIILHIILTIVGYFAVGLLCILVPEINENIPLFGVLSLSILFTAIGCEWFYQGIEDFLYITIRGIVVKIVSICFLFLCVKTKDDLIFYGIYSVIGSVGGNIFNFIRLRKLICINNRTIRSLKPFRHFFPAMKIFILNIAVSIYLQLNTVMLGFYNGSEAVGYYTAATKLMAVVLGLSNSLGPVIMPRMSNLISNNKESEFKELAQKAYNFSIFMSLPLSIGLFFISPYAISLLCGELYMPSVTASRIVSPIILIVSLSGFMGTQFLYPLGRVKLIIKSTIIGGCVAVLTNIILLPIISYNGAAISYLFAEIAVTVSLFFLSKEIIPVDFFNKSIKNYLFGSVLMAIVLFTISLFELDHIASFFAMLLFGSFTYLAWMLYLKEDFIMQIVKLFKKRYNLD